MCRMFTAFYSCSQLAEGRTTICSSFQKTTGKYCDGFASFSRMISIPCPECQAGRPHTQFKELSAGIDVASSVSMDHPAAPAAPVPIASAGTCNLADIMEPPQTIPLQTKPLPEEVPKSIPTSSGILPVALQAKQLPKEIPRSIPTSSRIAPKGAVRKPTLAPKNRMGLKNTAPVADMSQLKAPVAKMVASPKNRSRQPKVPVAQIIASPKNRSRLRKIAPAADMGLPEAPVAKMVASPRYENPMRKLSHDDYSDSSDSDSEDEEDLGFPLDPALRGL